MAEQKIAENLCSRSTDLAINPDPCPDLPLAPTAAECDSSEVKSKFVLRAFRFAGLLAFALVYFAAGKISLSLAYLHHSVSPFWPPTGIALAAAVLWGIRIWPGVLVGAFLVNLTTHEGASAGQVIAQAAGIAVGNTAEMMAGAWLVERFAAGRNTFRRVKTAYRYFMLAGAVSTAISATIGTSTLLLCGLLARNIFGAAWFTWWLGDMVGIMIIAPLILVWVNRPLPPFRRDQILEFAALLVALTAVLHFVFSDWFLPNNYPFAFLALPFFVWAAFRFELHGVVTVAAIVSGVVIVKTLQGVGPFVVADKNISLVLAQTFMVLITATALVLAAAVTERSAAEIALRREQRHLRRAQQQIRSLNAGLEQRVRERTAQLEALNEELEAFSYSVSHDLRAPLRATRGFAEILLAEQASQLDEKGRDYLRRTCDASAHMERLIEDLLRLSRVTRGELQTQEINLSLLAEEIAAEIKKSEPARDVEFAIAGDLRGYGDQRMVRQVMDNLLRNAWKFTGRQAHARIEFGRQDGPEGAYFVRDNGVGFDMNYGKKLFNVFQRLHSANEFPGTGVGLAIVKRIISRHGGRVWAESAADAGAAFYFTLPGPEAASENSAQPAGAI